MNSKGKGKEVNNVGTMSWVHELITTTQLVTPNTLFARPTLVGRFSCAAPSQHTHTDKHKYKKTLITFIICLFYMFHVLFFRNETHTDAQTMFALFNYQTCLHLTSSTTFTRLCSYYVQCALDFGKTWCDATRSTHQAAHTKTRQTVPSYLCLSLMWFIYLLCHLLPLRRLSSPRFAI